MTQEEFDKQYKDVLDALLWGMAEHPSVDVKKFYNMSYFLENLAFFSPVIFGMIQDGKSKAGK